MSKERADIKFFTKPLTDTVRFVLADKVFPTENTDRWEQFLEDTKENDRVLAVLKHPGLDIELEMWCSDGDDYIMAPDKEDKRINLAYPIVAKVAEDTWELEGYADADCTVDFSSPTWEEDLRREMLSTLVKHAEKNDLSMTEVNPQVVF